MENKTLNTQNLEAVSGGQNYSANWSFGEKVTISSDRCPDCGKPLTGAGNYPERGYDVFICSKCYQYYAHFYVGDAWYRAYRL